MQIIKMQTKALILSVMVAKDISRDIHSTVMCM